MSELLASKLRMRLPQYQWQTSQMKRGFQKGRRRSNLFGSSLDFSDFRPYQLGDDVRQIDWNVYARTNRHYIKRFLDEQEISLTVYLDCSASMGLEGEKWDRAKSLVAAIGYLGLANDDRVSVIPVSKSNIPFTNKKGFVFSNEMLDRIKSFKTTTDTSFLEELPKYRQPKSTLSFIISDFLEPIEFVVEQLKLMQARQQLRVIHLLSKNELDPTVSGDLKLVDVEKNDNFVQVSVNQQVLMGYKDRVKDHCLKIEKICSDRGIGYIQVNTEQTMDEILFNELRKKGWLA